MTQWTQLAVDAIVKTGMAFAMQCDSLNYGGYGCYDMLTSTTPSTPKPQLTELASEVAKYGGTPG